MSSAWSATMVFKQRFSSSSCLSFLASETSMPSGLGLEWQYAYDVDEPVAIPDLLRPKTEEGGRRLLQHINDLGSKVTRDLLETIDIN